jgi:CRISPR-associated protein Csx10
MTTSDTVGTPETQEQRWASQSFGATANTLIVRVKMQADWHVGSGQGIPGGIDRLIQRDHRDLPFVPGKTLTGVWRDGCELAARALDSGKDDGPWHDCLDVLFGDEPTRPTRPRRQTCGKDQGPGAAAVSIRSAHLPDALVAHLMGEDSGRRLLREALTVVRPGVRIARASGAAMSKNLRFVEMARGGLTLYAAVTLELPDDQREAALALLTAGALMVEGLGANRRRGAGRCEIALLPEPEQVRAIDWLRKTDELPSRLNGDAGACAGSEQNQTAGQNPPPPEDGPAGETEAPSSTVAWFDVAFELDQPVSAPTRVVGNVGKGLDFVPGTNLLAWLASKTRVDLKPMIAAGTLRVLPLTPDVAGERGLPIPFALEAKKMGDGLRTPSGVVNRLRQTAAVSGPAQQRKQLRDGYVSGGDPSKQIMPHHETTPMILQTHNTVDEDTQKPTSAVGGVYSYEAIAAGTRLRTRIAVPNQAFAAFRSALAVGTVVPLGRSRKDTYGAARVIAVDGKDTTPQPGTEAAGGQLAVWCLSDVLLRDEALRPDPTVKRLRMTLAEALGAKLEPVEGKAMIRTRRLDGWQARWGLARPSLIGIAAGSCALFKIEGTMPTNEKIRKVMANGLGERRAEGYGDIWINPPLLDPADFKGWQAYQEDDKPAVGGDQAFALAGDTLDLAQRIEQEAWRRAIEKHAKVIVADREWRKKCLGWTICGQGLDAKSKPNTSQLGTVRRLLLGLPKTATGEADHNPVIAWMDGWPNADGNVQPGHVKPQEKGKDNWANERINKLRAMVSDPDTVWSDGGLGEEFAPPLLSGRPLAEVQADQWRHAVRALLLGAIRAHKRDLDTERGKQSGKSDTANTFEDQTGREDADGPRD